MDQRTCYRLHARAMWSLQGMLCIQGRILMPRGSCKFLVWLTASLALFGCTKEPLKAVDIGKDELCTSCRNMIVDKHYAAEFITRDGFVRKFDDIACMIQHAKTKVKKDSIAAYFAMDFPSSQWVSAQEAKYVRSDKFKTPKDGGILAFKDPARAQALATQYQAQLLTFDELMK